MGRMSLNKPAHALSHDDRQTLLALAPDSIRKGLCGEELVIDAAEYSPALQSPGASFVTINIDGSLRGCNGSLEARRQLVIDVVENAHAAAFRDPRFPALTWPEFECLDVHISVLSPPEPVSFSSEEDLIRQMRRGIDGLILEDGMRRGTFLPSVWAALPEPREFLCHLKQKAGLPPDYWSDTIKIQRYITESIS